MKIAVFVSDSSLSKSIGESTVRALRALKHEADISWHPVDLPEKAEFDLGLEIGSRCIGCNVGVPFVHWIVDEYGIIPPEWIQANLHGHLFFFVDQETSVRAHKQGIRVAEYLPLGADTLAPQQVFNAIQNKNSELTSVQQAIEAIKQQIENDTKEGKLDVVEKKAELLNATIAKCQELDRGLSELESKTRIYDVGHFGNPAPAIISVLDEIRVAYPAWKIGVWGNRESWAKTAYGSSWIGGIPNTNEMGDVLSQCRYYMADPERRELDYWYCQASLSACVALTESNTMGACWDAMEWTRTIYTRGSVDRLFASIGHSAAYKEIKRHQPKIMGFNSGAWTKDIEMKPSALYRNRFVDRMQYLLMLLETKNLYANAKGSCKEAVLTKLALKEEVAWMRLAFPSDEDKAICSLDFSRNIKPDEIPVILRRVARRFELMLVDDLAWRQRLEEEKKNLPAEAVH